MICRRKSITNQKLLTAGSVVLEKDCLYLGHCIQKWNWFEPKIIPILKNSPAFPIIIFLIMHNFHFWPHGLVPASNNVLRGPWFGIKVVVQG